MSSLGRAVVAVALSVGLAAAGTVLGGTAHAADTPKVSVVLSEFVLQRKPKTAAPGKVQFVLKNVGTETHEFVVVRGSDPFALPTDADGAVDEAQIPTTDQIGEVEDIASKKTAKKTFTLKAGKYIMFCNIVEDDPDTGETESHFAEGMVSTFTVKR
jgi:hypothetical protein